jgi:hypothetical protein
MGCCRPIVRLAGSTLLDDDRDTPENIHFGDCDPMEEAKVFIAKKQQSTALTSLRNAKIRRFIIPYSVPIGMSACVRIASP